jgi:hypothetical protein
MLNFSFRDKSLQHPIFVHLSIWSKLEEGPGAIQNSKDAENITQ